MNLVRWNPRGDIISRHRLNQMIEDFFPTTKHLYEPAEWNWNPSIDIYEEENNIVIKAEIPGVDKNDITVDVKDGVLTLKGERSTNKEVEEEKYYKREMRYGKFERSFTLPVEVNADKIAADYKDGVLKIEIPKPEVSKPKKITID